MLELCGVSLLIRLGEEEGVEGRADESESDRSENRTVSDDVTRSVLRSVDYRRKISDESSKNKGNLTI